MKGTAVVTGACGGIGSATCALLTARGLDVVGIDRRPGSDITVDVADAQATEAAGREAVGDRPVVALVNNAAWQLVASLEDLDDSSWRGVIDVNTGAAHRLTRL